MYAAKVSRVQTASIYTSAGVYTCLVTTATDPNISTLVEYCWSIGIFRDILQLK